MKDLTLITCSYNTPKIIETMMKSFKFHHNISNFPIIIMENSTNEETVDILKSYEIPFLRTVGGAHATQLERALKLCKTKYALVVDTDIVFTKNIESIFEDFKKNNLTLAGIECGDRGGFKLYPRIHPWFMFIDIEKVNSKNISFINFEKLERTDSLGFYSLTSDNTPTKEQIHYDVGSTFREDIIEAGFKVENRLDYEDYFKHYEGSSWRMNCGDKELERIAQETWNNYQNEIEKYKDVDLLNSFK